MVFCPNLKILVLVLVPSWKTDELQSRTIELPFFAWSLWSYQCIHNNFVITPLAERRGPSFEKIALGIPRLDVGHRNCRGLPNALH